MSHIFSLKKLVCHEISKAPKVFSLDMLSRFMTEYPEQKFEDIDLPGQFMCIGDVFPEHTLKISFFKPLVNLVKHCDSLRRSFSIISNKGSSHDFVVLMQTNQSSIRSDRTLRMFDLIQSVLEKKSISRKYFANFSSQPAICISHNCRICPLKDEIFLDSIVATLHNPDDLSVLYRDSIKKGVLDSHMPIKKGVQSSFPITSFIEHRFAQLSSGTS